MRCVSYTRYVSHLPEKDTPTNIISLQNDRIDAYAKTRKWVISKRYSDREVNKKAEKAFTRLREDGMSRQFDMLILDSYYRLGPNIANARNILSELFYPAGIHFAVVEDDFCSMDKTPEEVAHYFTEKNINFRIAVRWNAHNALREKGFFSVHDEKYGYLLSDDHRNLIIDEEVAPIIIEVFELMASGNESMRSIAEKMRQKGYESPSVHLERVSVKHAKANGTEWTLHSVKTILNSRDYTGVIRRKFNGEYIEISIPSIISTELFEKTVAVRIARRANYHRGFKPKENLFRLIIRSAETDKTMICCEVGSDHERRYCRNRKTKEESIPYEDVVAAVIDLLKEEQALARRIGEYLTGEEAEAEMKRRRQVVIDAMTSIIREISMIAEQRQIAETTFSPELSEATLNDLDMRLAELEDEFRQKQDELLIVAKTFLKNPWVKLYSDIDLSVKPTNMQMKKWIEMVWVHDLKEVTIDVKHSEWKQLLPEEWIEEVRRDGKEK